MTKGKHGRRAENRTAAADEQSAPYQRRIATLTTQVKALQQHKAARTQGHAIAVRRLRAEPDEGISSALRMAQNEARRLRDERDSARQLLARKQKRLERSGLKDGGPHARRPRPDRHQSR